MKVSLSVGFVVLDYILTAKPTDSDTFIVEVHYGNESNASFVKDAKNARWNAVVAYLNHDFNDQWALNTRAELFEDAHGARTCTGAVTFNAGNNTCANSPAGFSNPNVPINVAPTPGVNDQTATGKPFQVGGIPQTLQSYTFTLQYKPAPALITRTEFRYDISNKDVFLYGSRPVDNQQTLTFNVVYLY